MSQSPPLPNPPPAAIPSLSSTSNAVTVPQSTTSAFSATASPSSSTTSSLAHDLLHSSDCSSYFHLHTLNRHTLLLQQGSLCPGLFVISRGEVRVQKELEVVHRRMIGGAQTTRKTIKPMHIALVGQGEIVGDIGLFEGQYNGDGGTATYSSSSSSAAAARHISPLTVISTSSTLEVYFIRRSDLLSHCPKPLLRQLKHFASQRMFVYIERMRQVLNTIGDGIIGRVQEKSMTAPISGYAANTTSMHETNSILNGGAISHAAAVETFWSETGSTSGSTKDETNGRSHDSEATNVFQPDAPSSSTNSSAIPFVSRTSSVLSSGSANTSSKHHPTANTTSSSHHSSSSRPSDSHSTTTKHHHLTDGGASDSGTKSRLSKEKTKEQLAESLNKRYQTQKLKLAGHYFSPHLLEKIQLQMRQAEADGDVHRIPLKASYLRSDALLTTANGMQVRHSHTNEQRHHSTNGEEDRNGGSGKAATFEFLSEVYSSAEQKRNLTGASSGAGSNSINTSLPNSLIDRTSSLSGGLGMSALLTNDYKQAQQRYDEQVNTASSSSPFGNNDPTSLLMSGGAATLDSLLREERKKQQDKREYVLGKESEKKMTTLKLVQQNTMKSKRKSAHYTSSFSSLSLHHPHASTRISSHSHTQKATRGIEALLQRNAQQRHAEEQLMYEEIQARLERNENRIDEEGEGIDADGKKLAGGTFRGKNALVSGFLTSASSASPKTSGTGVASGVGTIMEEKEKDISSNSSNDHPPQHHHQRTHTLIPFDQIHQPFSSSSSTSNNDKSHNSSHNHNNNNNPLAISSPPPTYYESFTRLLSTTNRENDNSDNNTGTSPHTTSRFLSSIYAPLPIFRRTPEIALTQQQVSGKAFGRDMEGVKEMKRMAQEEGRLGGGEGGGEQEEKSDDLNQVMRDILSRKTSTRAYHANQGMNELLSSPAPLKLHTSVVRHHARGLSNGGGSGMNKQGNNNSNTNGSQTDRPFSPLQRLDTPPRAFSETYHSFSVTQKVLPTHAASARVTATGEALQPKQYYQHRKPVTPRVLLASMKPTGMEIDANGSADIPNNKLAQQVQQAETSYEQDRSAAMKSMAESIERGEKQVGSEIASSSSTRNEEYLAPSFRVASRKGGRESGSRDSSKPTTSPPQPQRQHALPVHAQEFIRKTKEQYESTQPSDASSQGKQSSTSTGSANTSRVSSPPLPSLKEEHDNSSTINNSFSITLTTPRSALIPNRVSTAPIVVGVAENPLTPRAPVPPLSSTQPISPRAGRTVTPSQPSSESSRTNTAVAPDSPRKIGPRRNPAAILTNPSTDGLGAACILNTTPSQAALTTLTRTVAGPTRHNSNTQAGSVNENDLTSLTTSHSNTLRSHLLHAIERRAEAMARKEAMKQSEREKEKQERLKERKMKLERTRDVQALLHVTEHSQRILEEMSEHGEEDEATAENGQQQVEENFLMDFSLSDQIGIDRPKLDISSSLLSPTAKIQHVDGNATPSPTPLDLTSDATTHTNGTQNASHGLLASSLAPLTGLKQTSMSSLACGLTAVSQLLPATASARKLAQLYAHFQRHLARSREYFAARSRVEEEEDDQNDLTAKEREREAERHDRINTHVDAEGRIVGPSRTQPSLAPLSIHGRRRYGVKSKDAEELGDNTSHAINAMKLTSYGGVRRRGGGAIGMLDDAANTNKSSSVSELHASIHVLADMIADDHKLENEQALRILNSYDKKRVLIPTPILERAQQLMKAIEETKDDTTTTSEHAKDDDTTSNSTKKEDAEETVKTNTSELSLKQSKERNAAKEKFRLPLRNAKLFAPSTQSERDAKLKAKKEKKLKSATLNPEQLERAIAQNIVSSVAARNESSVATSSVRPSTSPPLSSDPASLPLPPAFMSFYTSCGLAPVSSSTPSPHHHQHLAADIPQELGFVPIVHANPSSSSTAGGRAMLDLVQARSNVERRFRQNQYVASKFEEENEGEEIEEEAELDVEEESEH